MIRRSAQRLLCLIVSIVIALSPISAAAATGQSGAIYDAAQIEEIQERYLFFEPMLEDIFTSPNGIGYWTQIEANRDDKVAIWSIDFASQVLDVEPSEQMYSEILANLCALLQGSIESGISQQQGLEGIKSKGDIDLEVAEIALSFVGDNLVSDDMSMILNTALEGKDVVVDSLGEAQYYREALVCYSSSAALLEALSQYSDNEMLSDVAERLLEANESLLFARLEYLANTSEDLAVYEAEFFRDHLAFSLIRDSDLYRTDDVVKWFVDGADGILGKFSTLYNAGEFAFKSAVAVGDLAFGTTNTFLHYQEMTALADMANALVEAISKAPRADGDPNEQTLAAIHERCSLYRSLLAVHARGEYSLYTLLTSDAGLLSILSQPDGGDADEWYEGQIDVITTHANSIENLLEVISESDVQTGSASISRGVFYKYENNGYEAYFRVDQNGNAGLQYYAPGISATVEDFYFSWNDGQASYQLNGARSGESFNIIFSPIDEKSVQITVTCRQPYFSWEGMREGDSLWSDAVFEMEEVSSTSNEQVSTRTELSGYIRTPVNGLVELLPNMSDEGVSVGVGFTNGTIVVEGPSVDGEIYYIGINEECPYSLLGIYVDMELTEACSSVEEKGGILDHHAFNSDGSEYWSFSLPDSLIINIYGEDVVGSVSLMASEPSPQ